MAAGPGRTAGCALLSAPLRAPRPGFYVSVATKAVRVFLSPDPEAQPGVSPMPSTNGEGLGLRPLLGLGSVPRPKDGSRPLLAQRLRAPGQRGAGREGAKIGTRVGRPRRVAPRRSRLAPPPELQLGEPALPRRVCPGSPAARPGTGSRRRHLRVPRPCTRASSGGRAAQRLARVRVCAGRGAQGGCSPQRPGVWVGEGASLSPNLGPNEMQAWFATPSRRTLGKCKRHWQIQGKQAEFLLATK